MQDKMDNFDWTRQNALTQNPKRTVNTGPPTDISGTQEGMQASSFPVAQLCAYCEGGEPLNCVLPNPCQGLLSPQPPAPSPPFPGSRGWSADLLSRHTHLLCMGCREQAVNLHATDWH